MLQAIKLTFGSVWGWLGIIVGAISLINLGVMYFEVGIGPVLERVVDTYKSIVHVGLDYLFFWVDWTMPPWLKDIITLYFVIGAGVTRATNIFIGSKTDIISSQAKLSRAIGFLLWPTYVLTLIQLRKENHRRLLDGKIEEKEYFAYSQFDDEFEITILVNVFAVVAAALLFVFIGSGL